MCQTDDFFVVVEGAIGRLGGVTQHAASMLFFKEKAVRDCLVAWSML